MFFFFFFNDTATTEIYTLSLHDALPISRPPAGGCTGTGHPVGRDQPRACRRHRSEEHTSELQSQSNLVCRLLLEKKKKMMSRSDMIIEIIGRLVRDAATLIIRVYDQITC